jgi:imidazolonepropionase-like amidohydrolase
MGVETIIKDAFLAAREYRTEWDAYNRLSRKQQERTVPPRRDLQLDALVDILETRMFVQCHAYVATEILMLMRLAEEFGFTLWNFIHVLEGYKVAEEMAEHGATATTFSDWWAYKFEVYDAIPYNPCIMHDQGVLTTVNSDDAELARHLNQEAAKSVMYCDMPEAEALNLVTLYAAQQMRVADRVGSIRVGKDADFVIWSDHPLSVYTKAEQTWIDGTKYFDLERDRLLREQQRLERTALVQKVLDAGGGRASGKPHGRGYGRGPGAIRGHNDGSYNAGATNHE